MTIMIIPLQAIPSQSVSYTLNGIAYTADIESLRGNLYVSVWQSGAYVLRNRALRSYAPVGFGLQLADTAGTDDPEYAGLGSRWILLGLEE